MIRITRPGCAKPSALSNGDYKHPDNKTALKNASFDKCMYCESKISATYFGDIEHIKPKSRFPELEFDWNNLGYVCARCNNSKRDQFDDQIPFIDPYQEDPNDNVVAVGAFLQPKQGSARGEMTINTIALNRAALVEKRQEKIDRIERAIAACYRAPESLKKYGLLELKKEAEPQKEYSLSISGLLGRNKLTLMRARIA